ncbi:MAG: hypothetical protein O3C57_03840 [Verrucomicrobia bacterium]|nr:hypothetical protein [Verrucomicrobiota bacterium]
MANVQSLFTILCATLLTPWCVARRIAPQSGLTASIVTAGVCGIALNTFVPIVLHLLKWPIIPASLCAAHVTIAAAALLISFPPARLLPPSPDSAEKSLLGFWGLFILLVIPFTPLAGIDTYKWQGLATNVEVEQCVPWFVHPLSLLGFTPRAYPSAQPLLLATVQMGPLAGVSAGYFWVSVLSGSLGLWATFMLGRRLLPNSRSALLMALLYVFSPVFMRYNHWATGRGLFLALFPCVLYALISALRLRNMLALGVTAMLLPLTHKAGLIALGILPLALLSRLALPRCNSRFILPLLVIPFLLAAIALSPAHLAPFPLGCMAGFAEKSITRFAWTIPMAALSMFVCRDWFTSRSRAFVLPMLVTLPLAYPADMYGALLALPFITLATAKGITTLADVFPKYADLLTRLAICLSVAGAVTIVIHRNLNATPKRVRAAAAFLEAHDPLGPYRVHAPDRARVQIHAYVSGCPRFVITRPDKVVFTTRRPPGLTGTPGDLSRDWIDFMRNFFEAPEIEMDWYGLAPRQYYVRIDGAGEIPDSAQELYAQNGIEIYAPKDQVDPHVHP